MKTLISAVVLLTSCLLSLEAAEMYPVKPSDKAFFDQVRKAVLTDDVEWLSRALSSYPFTVKLKAGQIKLKNEADLKKHAPAILTAKLKEVVRNQSPDSLFKNWQGVMVGSGEIWFSEIGKTNENKLVWVYRITAINLPGDRSTRASGEVRKQNQSGKPDQ